MAIDCKTCTCTCLEYVMHTSWHMPQDRAGPTSLQVATSKNEVLQHITNRRQVHPVGEHALLLRLLLEADEESLQACCACRVVVWVAHQTSSLDYTLTFMCLGDDRGRALPLP